MCIIHKCSLLAYTSLLLFFYDRNRCEETLWLYRTEQPHRRQRERRESDDDDGILLSLIFMTGRLHTVKLATLSIISNELWKGAKEANGEGEIKLNKVAKHDQCNIAILFLSFFHWIILLMLLIRLFFLSLQKSFYRKEIKSKEGEIYQLDSINKWFVLELDKEINAFENGNRSNIAKLID